MHDGARRILGETAWGNVLEAVFVFLPYVVVRPFTPKTSFRDSLKRTDNKSEKNSTFFFVETWITKIFYIFAKHFIGHDRRRRTLGETNDRTVSRKSRKVLSKLRALPRAPQR